MLLIGQPSINGLFSMAMLNNRLNNQMVVWWTFHELRPFTSYFYDYKQWGCNSINGVTC